MISWPARLHGQIGSACKYYACRFTRHLQLDVLEHAFRIAQKVLQIPRDDDAVRWLDGAQERLVGVLLLEEAPLGAPQLAIGHEAEVPFAMSEPERHAMVYKRTSRRELQSHAQVDEREGRAVRVDAEAALEQVVRRLRRVEEDDRLAEHLQVDDIAIDLAPLGERPPRVVTRDVEDVAQYGQGRGPRRELRPRAAAAPVLHGGRDEHQQERACHKGGRSTGGIDEGHRVVAKRGAGDDGRDERRTSDDSEAPRTLVPAAELPRDGVAYGLWGILQEASDRARSRQKLCSHCSGWDEANSWPAFAQLRGPDEGTSSTAPDAMWSPE